MNRRTIIILVVALLIVVCMSIAGYFFFSSPSGQAWERDWIGNPIGLTAIATVGAAVGTVSAVVVALFVTGYERRKAREEREDAQNRFEAEQRRAREVLEDERRRFQEAQEEGRRQFLASQKQTQDALEEGRRQFLEAQYAAHRPLLVPLDRHLDDIPAVIEWNASVEFINIQNAGTGVANNIWGVFMPPVSWSTTVPPQKHIHLATPLPPGAKSSEECTDTIFKWGGTIFNTYDKISEHTLGVPEERALNENFNHLEKRDWCIARLTLTCSDVFGKKHASIFDYTTMGVWVNVAFISNIEHDLGEMNEAKGIELSKGAREPSSPNPT